MGSRRPVHACAKHHGNRFAAERCAKWATRLFFRRRNGGECAQLQFEAVACACGAVYDKVICGTTSRQLGVMGRVPAQAVQSLLPSGGGSGSPQTSCSSEYLDTGTEYSASSSSNGMGGGASELACVVGTTGVWAWQEDVRGYFAGFARAPCRAALSEARHGRVSRCIGHSGSSKTYSHAASCSAALRDPDRCHLIFLRSRLPKGQST
jgi:hypothetical protein